VLIEPSQLANFEQPAVTANGKIEMTDAMELPTEEYFDALARCGESFA
jgi:hypothetical protein